MAEAASASPSPLPVAGIRNPEEVISATKIIKYNADVVRFLWEMVSD